MIRILVSLRTDFSPEEFGVTSGAYSDEDEFAEYVWEVLLAQPGMLFDGAVWEVEFVGGDECH